MTEAWSLVAGHWPALTAVAALLLGVYLVIRAIWRTEMRDLSQRIEYLDKRVRALLHRDNCYFDFMVWDAAYHHRQELLAAENGWVLERHTPFLEFRARWVRDHGLEDDLDIWK